MERYKQLCVLCCRLGALDLTGESLGESRIRREEGEGEEEGGGVVGVGVIMKYLEQR